MSKQFQFTRPDIWKASNAQEAHDQAHAYLTHLTGRLIARLGGSAHRKTDDWGAAGTIQHQIDLMEELFDSAI